MKCTEKLSYSNKNLLSHDFLTYILTVGDSRETVEPIGISSLLF